MTKMLRIQADDDLYRRYKVLCAHLDLSMTKQTLELIKIFIEVQENNIKIISKDN